MGTHPAGSVEALLMLTHPAQRPVGIVRLASWVDPSVTNPPRLQAKPAMMLANPRLLLRNLT